MVDPEHKLALDIDPANNAWLDDKGQARRAALKWSARFLFWLQSLLELQQSAGSSFECIEGVKTDLFPDEIYVFTPEVRIMELPAGATPVDFAYTVHTDIGHACVGSRVDRHPYPLSSPLHSGQTVEIITAPGARPNAAWLNFVVTTKARSKIRQFLKNLRTEESVVLGRRLQHHDGLLAQADLVDQLQRQPRLADPRFAGDFNALAASGFHPLPHL